MEVLDHPVPAARELIVNEVWISSAALDSSASSAANEQVKLGLGPAISSGINSDINDDDHYSAPTKLLVASVQNASGLEGNTPTELLPNQLVTLEATARTDLGLRRGHNEDYFFSQTHLIASKSPLGDKQQARGLYILCDGMGGHAHGEVASSLAATMLADLLKASWQQQLPDEDQLLDAIAEVNQALYEVNEQNMAAGSGRMGTTLVVALVQDTQVRVAHVGDSRLYRLTRERGLEQITFDHVVAAREMQRGASPTQAYKRPDAHQLTQALGPKHSDYLNPTVQTLTIGEDTLLILGSDGLTDRKLLETHAAAYLQPLLAATAGLEEGVDQLIQVANDHNGHDNITVIAVRIRLQPLVAETQDSLLDSMSRSL